MGGFGRKNYRDLEFGVNEAKGSMVFIDEIRLKNIKTDTILSHTHEHNVCNTRHNECVYVASLHARVLNAYTYNRLCIKHPVFVLL